MRSWSGRLLQREGEEISPWVGLSFGALYLAAVAAVGLAAFHVQRSELASQRIDSAKQSVRWLSRYLARARDEEPAAASREIRHAALHEDITFCAVVSADGTIVDHSNPTRIGQRAGALTWRNSDPVDVRVGTAPSGGAQSHGQSGRPREGAAAVRGHRHPHLGAPE